MNTKTLIDSIVRQTTVLIAQLTASAGMRAPMAHLADDMFLTLSKELEQQGLSQNVLADMFGVALRSYQRRVHRLQESPSDGRKTLWEAVLGYIEQKGPLERSEVLRRFSHDDPGTVRSVLQDLHNSGLVTRQGTGDTARLNALDEQQRKALARSADREFLATLVWLELTRNPGSTQAQLEEKFSISSALCEGALDALRHQAELSVSPEGEIRIESLVIPIGSEAGWETAVLDHFQAMCGAVIEKLRRGKSGSSSTDRTGGATCAFDLSDDHPLKPKVEQLLRETNDRASALWDEVEEYNEKHPIPEEELKRVIFYYGQNMPEDLPEEGEA